MLGACLALSPAKPASAQLQNNTEAPEASVAERQSVLQRAHPDYDVPGTRIGSFIASTSLDADETYASNIYATPSNPIGDFETTLSPSGRLQSDWSNHSLGFVANGAFHRYLTHMSENDTDHTLGANGRADLFSDTYVSFQVTDLAAHEARSSPDSVGNQKSPIGYEELSTHVTLSHETYRIGFRLEGNADRFLYHDSETDTGALIPETFRDRVDYLVTPRLSYEILPGYHAFVKAPLNEHDYDTTAGINRDSHGTEVDIGTAIDLGTVITAELFAGTLHQSYDDPAFRPLSGISYGANGLWNFSPLSSLKLALTHTVQETTLAGTSADLQTTVSTSVEHELLPDLMVSAGGSYSRDEFKGSSREDSNYQGNAGFRYLLNRYLYLDVKGLLQTRQSTADAFDYRQDTISVTIHAQH